MNEYIDSLARVRVAVIGDLMLDCYLHGEVSRISPEAPVPVMRAALGASRAWRRGERGGEPRRARRARASRRPVRARRGARATARLPGRDRGRSTAAASSARPSRRTTKKLRIIGARQQIVRIDHEDTTPWSDELERACIAAAIEAIDAADVAVLSDYGKGVCSDALAPRGDRARGARRASGSSSTRSGATCRSTRGASILTPNRKELSDATGLPCETDDEAALAVAQAQETCDADVLLTRSEKGMSYFPRGGVPIHMPTVAQDVFDVSGAGDTVIAVLAAAVGANVPLLEGMRLANHAAGIVVSKVGTATVTRAELAESLVDDAPVAEEDGGRVELDEAIALRWRWARERLVVGFTNGCFDLLHPGHVALLQQAARTCDRLIVALNSDASVRRLKGPLASGAGRECARRDHRRDEGRLRRASCSTRTRRAG